MKIALIDLSHMTMGVHTNTVPLGIGIIASYLKSNIKNDLDIRLFKDHFKLRNTLKTWLPDIIGLAQYVWNSELNLYFARIIKKLNPDCLIIAGGPNLYLEFNEKFEYLKEHNYIDICVNYDGEIPFTEIVRRIIKGEKIESIRKTPVAGSYSIDQKTNNLIESQEVSPRVQSLDVFGPIYSSGLFDEFLDDGYHPFMQTQRGCPFQCAYCHASDKYYNKIIFLSPEIFRKDIEYLANRFKGEHNINLYLANADFGLFEIDLKITEIIRQIQDKYDWPKNVFADSANKPENVLKIISTLKYEFIPTLALQTLTDSVLKNINRKNLPFENFIEFQNKAVKLGAKNTLTELILNLPGETKESFLTTISKVLNSGVQNIVIYTLMSLRGTPLSLTASIKKYGYEIKYRIVPRCFSEINGAKIFEIEQVVVSSNTMLYEDYLDLRGLAFIITVFSSSAEMYPLRKFLQEHKINISDWILGIHKKIRDFNGFNSQYLSFLKETESELFPSAKDLRDFFKNNANFQLLLENKLGDNLLRKYKTIILSDYYLESIKIAGEVLQSLTRKKYKSDIYNYFIKDLITFLSTRDVSNLFYKKYDKNTFAKSIKLNYDIPKWLNNEKEYAPQSITSFDPSFYSVVLSDYTINRLKNFKKINPNPGLALQILYRDGIINDFWPEWIN